jgi:NAD-dependent DNA ligase
LNLGKDRVKSMVEAFEGKVTGAVSGRTHVLIVGKEPGLSKVSQAEGQPNCQLMVRFVRESSWKFA